MCKSCGKPYRPRTQQPQQQTNGGVTNLSITPAPKPPVINITPSGGYPVGGYRTKK